MQHTITIDCPPELLLGLHLDNEGFAEYLKKQAAISLFKEGKISSGTAAAWLGIGRMAFLRLAFDAGATLLDYTADWTGNGVAMIVFSNTTPLIALSSIQQMELLPRLFNLTMSS